MIFPAVHVDGFDVAVLLLEFLNGELRNARFSGPGGTRDECCIGFLSPCERFEGAREVVHLRIAVDHFTGDELRLEEAGGGQHI